MADIAITHWTRLGSAVRDARLAHCWSQDDLAQRAHVSRPWVSRVEGGHRSAELEQLLRVFAALDLAFIVREESLDRSAALTIVHSGPRVAPVVGAVSEERAHAAERRRASWETANSQQGHR